MSAVDKLVVVTRKTRFEELLERFNTAAQARFYIEHMGLDFAVYEDEHAVYRSALERLTRSLDGLVDKLQVVERGFLPTFLFTPRDAVVTVGMDGLVVNTAKYLDGQPIVAVNPDPQRIDGLLLPFSVARARDGVVRVLEGRARTTDVTMAEAVLNDGQRLLAFNDLLVGPRTHVSARYSLSFHGETEEQSSSGVLVSTGAGSTGWLSSTLNMASAVMRLTGAAPNPEPALRLGWDSPALAFVVREPFRSRSSGVRLTAGLVGQGEALTLESHMPENGVIFSDGIEQDALAFNAGAIATVRVADRRTRLVRA